MKFPGNSFKDALKAALIAASLLLVPLLAMQFSDEVKWTLFDFAVAWTLLFGAGFTYKLIVGKINRPVYRAAVGSAVGTGLFLIWSNLAVGLIGTGDNPANWMYLGVLAVVIIGTIIARFQPSGMARALIATALAQMLVAAIALMAGKHMAPESFVLEILGVNGVFAAMWTGSALLFRYSARAQS